MEAEASRPYHSVRASSNTARRPRRRWEERRIMLRNADDILGLGIQTTDETLGKIKDIHFDDAHWTVRYFVADTHRWLLGRKVLLSPESANQPDWDEQLLPVKLTRRQVENSPTLGADEPVSRQHEIDLASYYGWGTYWAPVGMPAKGMTPIQMHHYERVQDEDPGAQHPDSRYVSENRRPRLRSLNEVTGYHIGASDGDVGHVEDAILDTDDWSIRYLVVDTRNWLPGRKVLIAPDWIRSISWDQRSVNVDLTRDLIREAPEYDASGPVSREYEQRLYEHYDRQRYWQADSSATTT